MSTHLDVPVPATLAQHPSREQRHLIGAVIGLSLLLGLLVAAFALPALNAAPRNLPIGVAGPPAATGQLTRQLEARQPGAFAVSSFADEADLRAAIVDRDVYGGLAFSAAGPKLLVASAASPAVASALTGLGEALAPGVVTDDVVPLPGTDRRGVALPTALLPILLGAIAPVVLMVTSTRRPAGRILGVLAANLVTGFAVIAVLHGWLGVLSGSYLAESLALSVTLGAISMTLLGMHALLRWPGLGIGALTMLLLGLPLSGAQSAPELLPPFWAGLGQALPPGAGATLLRSVGYFDGRGSAAALFVLTAWLGGGLILVWLSTLRRGTSPVPGPDTTVEPTERQGSRLR